LKLRSNLQGYFLIFPALLFLIVFIIFPIFLGMYYSLHKWDGFSEPIFNGIQNYIDIIKNDSIFNTEFKNTMIYAIAVVIVNNAFGLLLAVLANQKLKGLWFYRTSLFIPVTMSFVAVGLLWSWMYNPDFGLINSMLKGVGLEQ